MLTKNSKNTEIIAELKDVSVPTVFATAQSSNPDYITLYIVQERDKAGDKTNVKNLLLGAGPSKRYVRHIEQANIAKVKSLGIKPGFKFEDFHVALIDTLEAPYPTAEPKRKGAEGEIVTHMGAPVYERTALTYGEAEDVKLSYDKDEVTEIKSVKASAPAEFAKS